MAGPLGEMFDHGQPHIPYCFAVDAHIHTGCDALNTTVRTSPHLDPNTFNADRA